MNIKDLEFGNVVKLRDGTLCLICPNIYSSLKKISDYLVIYPIDMICLRSIINGNLKTDLSNYNDNLSLKGWYRSFDYTYEDEDIMEVYEDYTLKNLLWKRETENGKEKKKVILKLITKLRRN